MYALLCLEVTAEAHIQRFHSHRPFLHLNLGTFEYPPQKGWTILLGVVTDGGWVQLALTSLSVCGRPRRACVRRSMLWWCDMLEPTTLTAGLPCSIDILRRTHRGSGLYLMESNTSGPILFV